MGLQGSSPGKSATSKRTELEQIEPVEGRVLRLALAPGHHRLRITFLNRVISDPALIEVEVRDGQVTPVEMTLTATGTAFVRTEEQRRGGTARGRYGRATKVASDESQMYRVTATLQTPRPYQLKEQMPYAQNPAK